MRLKLARRALVVTSFALSGVLHASRLDKLDFFDATSCLYQIEPRQRSRRI